MGRHVERSYRFAILPEWLLYHPDADAFDLRVFAVLDRHDGADCFPALATIARLTGKSEDTVRRSLRRLAKLGAIRVEARHDDGGRQTSNRYVLAGDAPVHDRPGTDATLPVAAAPPSLPGTGATLTRAIEEPEQSNDSAAAGVGAAKTPGQEAQRVMNDYWLWVAKQSGRPPVGVTAIAFKKLIEPFLAAGVTPAQVKWAVKAMYEAGRPLTRQGIEAQLDGRGWKPRAGRRDLIAELDELKFDDSGKLIAG